MNEDKTLQAVNDLVSYGLRKHLIEKEDVRYTANLLLDLMKLEPDGSYQCQVDTEKEYDLEGILKILLDDAVERSVIEEGIASRDLFDTRLMGALTPRPSDVIHKFNALYEKDKEAATDYFYSLSKDSDYIRTYRVKKDRKWKAETPYGEMDITINLSKPEKDPKAIAAALNKKSDSYPKCLLCAENEGYAGRLDHPARETIRLIPVTLKDAQFYMQYSPYVYYNEHCIVLSDHHHPMVINKDTFERLLEYVDKFPHYMLGSNADLPIVGGSILTHEHFQGGRYTFAMAKAPLREEIHFPDYEDLTCGIVNWPMSVIRIDGKDRNRIAELADLILQKWIPYSDESADILAYSGDTRHNTITPIARRRGDLFELDLVLRNNRTTDEYPLGIFHPHQEYHHIKKENIGLIEVMGLAVLPARLLKEMEELKDAMMEGKDIHSIEDLSSHADWADEIKEKYGEIKDRSELDSIIEKEIGIVFSKVLENCGVFKDTEKGHAQFHAFLDTIFE